MEPILSMRHLAANAVARRSVAGWIAAGLSAGYDRALLAAAPVESVIDGPDHAQPTVSAGGTWRCLTCAFASSSRGADDDADDVTCPAARTAC